MKRASVAFVDSFFKQWDKQPKKALSQNFLIDANVARKIVSYADISSQDEIIEIGPGLGAISEIIYNLTFNYTLIEKDALFISSLQEAFPHATILHQDVREHLFLMKQKRYKLLSNIPYHLSKEILEQIIQCSECFESATLLVQKEFAEKIAKPKKGEQRYIHTIAQLYAEVEIKQIVPKSVFYPKPNVESAVLFLQFNKVPPCKEFLPIIKEAFIHKRKRLTSSLKKFYSPELIVHCLQHINLPETARPEDLTPFNWIELLQQCKRVPLISSMSV